MSKEKRNDKTQAQNSVVSSAWFGNPRFIAQKFPAQFSTLAPAAGLATAPAM
jgi:hypothetical protein